MSEPTTTDTVSEAVFDSFVDYRKAVHDLLSDLDKLREYSLELGLSAKAAQIEAVVRRLADDKFSVAVVGEFKRGKSTFINALLGADVLPTDVLPCSATLNRVTYGLEKRAVLSFRDGTQREVPFERLSEHVTKLTEQSEELARSIEKATVYYPSPYCKNNVDVIDTPGLNDDDSMTEVTLSVLPQVDAAILVIRAQSPFGEYERNFLETRLLAADLGRVIFIVNGIDQLNSPAEAAKVVEGIEKRLRDNVMNRVKRQFGVDSDEYRSYERKVGAIRAFGLSAYQALEGKLHNDEARFEKSRFGAFEAELQRLLTDGRGAITLQVPLNRARAASGELLATLASHSAALALKGEEFEGAASASEAEVQKLRADKANELARIDRVSENLSATAAALADAFVKDFRQTIIGTIDAAQITTADISGKEARKLFDQQLGKALANASTAVVERYTTQLQQQTHAALVKAAQDIQGYDMLVNGLIERIAQRLQGIAEKDIRGTQTTDLAISAFVPVLGGIIAGSREHGIKGAIVGTATTFTTAAVGVAIATAIGIPLAFPLFAVVGVTSFFSSRWAANAVFSKSRIENFRKKVRDEALARLDGEVSLDRVREQFQRTTEQALSRFRQHVEENTDALLNDANVTLLKLREKYAAARTRTEDEVRGANDMKAAIEHIQAGANKLMQQLERVATT
jgi:predicted GTPase